MPTKTFTIERDGQEFEVEVNEGQDPNAVLSAALGQQAAAPERSLVDELLQLRGGMRGIPDPFAEEVKRGTGLGVRGVVEAAPKAVTSVQDTLASLLNLIPAAISKGDVALGGKPTDARLPTNATASLEGILDQVFPQAESFGEKAVLGGGELALTGGVGGAALAPKVGQAVQEVGGVARLPGAQGSLKGLGDLIGEFFAKSPGKFATAEFAGGTGAVGADELAQEAGASPLQRMLATLAGGTAAAVVPQAGVNLARNLSTKAMNFATNSGTELRAARALQEASADPAAAAAAAREAPEGVLPARAAQDPGLQAMESKVLADNPALDLRTQRNLAEAEQNLEKVARAEFGPGTTKQQFQHRVVQETAPEGTTIVQGQPDEMLGQSFRAFKSAYAQAEGHVIKVNVPIGRNGISIPQGLLDAVFDPAILTGPEVRRRVGEWLQGRYAATVRQGQRVGGPADNPVFEIDSKDLLELRHVIRTQQRAKARAGATSADAAAEAELLENADAGLTRVIEEQLPPEVAAGLSATDAKYVNFKTVERAVRRSGKDVLTADGLRNAIASRSSEGQFARGETGRLGELSEQGANVNRILVANDVEAAERMVRSMNPTELAAAKGDFVNALNKRATKKFQGADRLKGEDLLNELKKSRKVLTTAGFSADDFNRIERIGRQLKVIQGKSATAVTELLTDDVSTVMRLLAAIAGSRFGIAALKLFGGSGGAGPSLILAQFGSRTMQSRLTQLSVNDADLLIRGALRGDTAPDGTSLFAALLTKPTDPIIKQSRAAKTIQAWLIQAGAAGAEATPTIEEE